MAQKVSNTTTDHETIRRWAQERGGSPAAVEGTSRGEDDPGMIRIDVPGYSGEGKLRRIEWDQWFKKFDESGLALVYEDVTASGERSNFNKLVARETAGARAQGQRTSARARQPSTSAPEGERAQPRKRAQAGGRGGARAVAKRAGGRRQASRAEAARTTSSRGGGAAGRGASSRGTSSRGASARGGSKKGTGRSSSRGQTGRGGSRGGRGRSQS
jgi:hypothetical protein